MKLQRQLSNGVWFDVEEGREDHFATLAAKFNPTLDVRVTLAAGQTVKYGPDWYENIRASELVKPKCTADPNFSNNGWVLDCGCTVYHRSHIMRSSRGTSCVDCYDRMSN